MANDIRKVAQQQFGAHANNYVTSTDHAAGGSLPRLLALTDPQPEWCALDIATGGGHTALAFAPHCKIVIASDLTFQMLAAARRFDTERSVENTAYCQHDAESLPYPDSLFNLVTCRIAPHHFADIPAFVSEAARVLKPGGKLAVADNVVTGEPKVSRFVNTFEKLRDPSHNWAFSEADWETFIVSAGLVLRHTEIIEKRIVFDRWAARMSVSGSDLTRLQALLLRAPTEPRNWLKMNEEDSQLSFVLREGIFIADKP